MSYQVVVELTSLEEVAELINLMKTNSVRCFRSCIVDNSDCIEAMLYRHDMDDLAYTLESSGGMIKVKPTNSKISQEIGKYISQHEYLKSTYTPMEIII